MNNRRVRKGDVPAVAGKSKSYIAHAVTIDNPAEEFAVSEVVSDVGKVMHIVLKDGGLSETVKWGLKYKTTETPELAADISAFDLKQAIIAAGVVENFDVHAFPGRYFIRFLDDDPTPLVLEPNDWSYINKDINGYIYPDDRYATASSINVKAYDADPGHKIYPGNWLYGVKTESGLRVISECREVNGDGAEIESSTPPEGTVWKWTDEGTPGIFSWQVQSTTCASTGMPPPDGTTPNETTITECPP